MKNLKNINTIISLKDNLKDIFFSKNILKIHEDFIENKDDKKHNITNHSKWFS